MPLTGWSTACPWQGAQGGLLRTGLMERSTSRPSSASTKSAEGLASAAGTSAGRRRPSLAGVEAKRTSPAGLRIITLSMPDWPPMRVTMSARPGTSRLSMAFSSAAWSSRLKPSEARLRSPINWSRYTVRKTASSKAESRPAASSNRVRMRRFKGENATAVMGPVYRTGPGGAATSWGLARRA